MPLNHNQLLQPLYKNYQDVNKDDRFNLNEDMNDLSTPPPIEEFDDFQNKSKLARNLKTVNGFENFNDNNGIEQDGFKALYQGGDSDFLFEKIDPTQAWDVQYDQLQAKSKTLLDEAKTIVESSKKFSEKLFDNHRDKQLAKFDDPKNKDYKNFILKGQDKEYDPTKPLSKLELATARTKFKAQLKDDRTNYLTKLNSTHDNEIKSVEQRANDNISQWEFVLSHTDESARTTIRIDLNRKRTTGKLNEATKRTKEKGITATYQSSWADNLPTDTKNIATNALNKYLQKHARKFQAGSTPNGKGGYDAYCQDPTKPKQRAAFRNNAYHGPKKSDNLPSASNYYLKLCSDEQGNFKGAGRWRLGNMINGTSPADYKKKYDKEKRAFEELEREDRLGGNKITNKIFGETKAPSSKDGTTYTNKDWVFDAGDGSEPNYADRCATQNTQLAKLADWLDKHPGELPKGVEFDPNAHTYSEAECNNFGTENNSCKMDDSFRRKMDMTSRIIDVYKNHGPKKVLQEDESASVSTSKNDQDVRQNESSASISTFNR